MPFKSLLPHACWLAIASGAFYVGYESRGLRDLSVTPNAAPVQAAVKKATGAKPLQPVAGAPPVLHGQELAKALKATFSEVNRQQRQLAFAQLLQGINAEDCPAVLKMFHTSDTQGRWYVEEWEAFWRKWGELDPDAAFDLKNGSSGSDDVTREMVRAAVLDRGAGEAKRLMEKPAVKQSSKFFGAAVEAVAVRNPQEAVLLAVGVPQGDYQKESVLGLLEGATENGGFKGAQAAFEALSVHTLNPKIMTEGLTRLASIASRLGGGAAADLIVKYQEKEYCTPEVVARTLNDMSYHAPQGTLDLLTRLDSEFTKSQAPAILRRLSVKFPDQVRTWVQENAGKPNFQQISAMLESPK